MSEGEAPPPRLEPEEQARADFYALLARLFSAPPDAALLRAIADAPPLGPVEVASDEDASVRGLAASWDALRAASADAETEAVRDEYQALFIGIGRSEVSPYASHYLGRQSERPLVDIRAALAELGLARRSETSEFEDHIAVVFEAMRMLIAGDGERPPAQIGQQRRFFERFVVPWACDCCNAIENSSIADYWRHVAQFTRCFVGVETAAFAIA